MAPGPEFSVATARDADEMAATLAAGFETYREFAAPGWMPPDVAEGLSRMRELLRDAGTWGFLAREGSAPAGHVAFYPAQQRRPGEPPAVFEARPPVPGLAHLWQLFVRPSHFGTGLAATLHDRCVEEMRARGYEAARLYTPVDHARARRFYERRDWVAGAAAFDEPLGLEVIEYRLDL